ncbi:hypothetical protein K439DRAFT_1635200 [Ramaria rubella]|nr:hypothetical protein K439DRAFT_1635200 [Ramaria rubella]
MAGKQSAPTTPTRPLLPLRLSANKETPVKQKHVSGQDYRSGDLGEGRLAVLRDLGRSIPEVPIEWVLESIIPRVACDLDSSIAFKPFASMIEKIIDAARAGVDPLLTFYDNPHRAPTSVRSNDTRPDGYLVRLLKHPDPTPSKRSKSKAPLHRWDDIALSAEYKKSNTGEDTDDNAQKIIWSMHHIMRSDPCRRFTFGFTVENTQMRIWFACRSRVFVTAAFNFILDHDTVIRFFIACAYATEAELGWDPTVQRIYVDGEPQYKFTVHDVEGANHVETVFRTTRVLADFSAGALRGRGTRVFEAFQLGSDPRDDTPVVIKDSWVDIDRAKEGGIRSKFESEADGEDKAKIQQYFMTVLHYGEVMINGQADRTLDVMLRGQELPEGSEFKLNLKDATTVSRPSSIGAHPSVPSLARAPHKSVRYQHKVHYRIVFKEVGMPIHSVTGQLDIFQTLEDATSGLELLHRYGWVHRDISSGNLLVVRGRGKISDLEYTKKTSEHSDHNIRTGTMDFMSLEVEALKYLFHDDDSLVPSQIRTLFHYNPLHDLESLWWIGVWMMFYHRPTVEQNDQEQIDKEYEAAIEQYKIHQNIFPGFLNSASRSRTLTLSTELASNLDSLPNSCYKVALRLNRARRILVKAYQTAEAGPEINESAFIGIHQQLLESYGDAREQSGNIKLRSLTDILQIPKRTREEEDTGVGGKLIASKRARV